MAKGKRSTVMRRDEMSGVIIMAGPVTKKHRRKQGRVYFDVTYRSPSSERTERVEMRPGDSIEVTYRFGYRGPDGKTVWDDDTEAIFTLTDEHVA